MTYQIVPSAHGKMLVNDRDKYIGKSFIHYGEFSRMEMNLLKKYTKKDKLFLDIGANIGSHTVALAPFSHTTVAFEAQRHQFQMLNANIAINSLWNVYTHNVIVSSELGSMSIPVLDPEKNNSFGSFHIREGKGDSTPIVTIDKFSFWNVGLIKIDVEGMEPDVMKGALLTIVLHKPVLYIEADRIVSKTRIISMLEDLNYEYEEHNVPIFDPDNYNKNEEDMFNGEYSLNLLCIPKNLAQLYP